MVNTQKSVFWKAALLTLVIFILGVTVGYLLENNRIKEIETTSKIMEIEWADAKLQSLYYQSINPRFCKAAIDENLIFADRAYHRYIKLDEYEEANQLTSEILLDKKKYALLKTEFWLNSIALKERCKTNYTNLLYFYTNTPSINEGSKQKTQAIILKNLKEKYGPDLMLIPLPIDLDISIINIMKESYNITSTPTMLINEKIKLEGLHEIEEIERVFNKTSLGVG